MIVVHGTLSRGVEMRSCLVGHISMVSCFFRVSSSFTRCQLGTCWSTISSNERLVDSYKLVYQVVDIAILTLLASQLLLEQLSHVVQDFFISLVF